MTPSPTPGAETGEEDGDTRFGFKWGPMWVERLCEYRGSRAIGLYVGGPGLSESRKQKLEIYVSPTGRSVRVWRDGKELS